MDHCHNVLALLGRYIATTLGSKFCRSSDVLSNYYVDKDNLLHDSLDLESEENTHTQLNSDNDNDDMLESLLQPQDDSSDCDSSDNDFNSDSEVGLDY